ncbi:MAG: DUF2142 domain-containing protein [Catenulispora sp.]|nr:DUF2142 domain-containing protein [Catenulispora sp.]
MAPSPAPATTIGGDVVVAASATATEAATATGRRGRLSGGNRCRRAWWTAFVALFLMMAGWAVAMPEGGNSDEVAHIERAYAAATGQVVGAPSRDTLNRPAATFAVPASLIPRDVECMYRSRTSAACLSFPTTRNFVKVNSWTGRYNPLYYLPTGIPMAISPTFAGVVAGRLVSALMCAAVLASAFSAAVRMGSRLLNAAVLLAITPAALDLCGAINPNGMEIAAAVLMWTSGLVLIRRGDALSASDRARLRAMFVVAACILLVVRALGPLWFGLSICALALVLGRRRTWEVLRSRPIWPAALIGGAGVVGVAWNMVADNYSYYPMQSTTDNLYRNGLLFHSTASNLAMLLENGVDTWIREDVGVAVESASITPWVLVLLWLMPVSALIAAGLLSTTRNHRIAILAVVVAPFAVTAYVELSYVRMLGWTQNGRYFLPLSVGAVLIAAAVAPRFPKSWNVAPRVIRTTVVITGICHLASLAIVLSRFKSGFTSAPNPLGGSWHPPFGTAVPFVLMVAGLMVQSRAIFSRASR